MQRYTFSMHPGLNVWTLHLRIHAVQSAIQGAFNPKLGAFKQGGKHQTKENESVCDFTNTMCRIFL